MSQSILQKYARLLCEYCVSLKAGDKLLIRSTTLAEPLIHEVYKAALKAGAIPEVMMEWQGKDQALQQLGTRDQWSYVPMQYAQAMESFDAYILIKAPYNLKENYNATEGATKAIREAWSPYQQLYFKRTATLDLKRTFCLYPTIALAQEAGMSLEDYEHFVFDACHLYEEDPIAAWLELKNNQQHIVDYLNERKTIRYKSSDLDISFSTEGRTWINSHGTTNMPSGEVYTSPVEDSVNGTVFFHYPLIYDGEELEEVRLIVEKGLITKWHASRGQKKLDSLMQVEGARRFGEAAIGTNKRINRFTKQILFDEKIGGTIHMAIGQSYLQAGGKNQSAVHVDMIADMKNGGKIFADETLIYENGEFLI
jgi:aminopeptidase